MYASNSPPAQYSNTQQYNDVACKYTKHILISINVIFHFCYFKYTGTYTIFEESESTRFVLSLYSHKVYYILDTACKNKLGINFKYDWLLTFLYLYYQQLKLVISSSLQVYVSGRLYFQAYVHFWNFNRLHAVQFMPKLQ